MCKGPGCEDSWPAARLSILRDLPLDLRVDARDDHQGRFDGSAADGADWSVTALGDRLYIGQPDPGRVVREQDRRLAGPFTAEATWTGSGTRFGTSVAVVPGADGTHDLWVGAPDASLSRGAVHIFRDVAGDGGRDAADADLVLYGSTVADQLGERIVPCGDLTGDGLPEVALQVPWFSSSADWGIEGAPAVADLAGAVVLVRSEQLVGKQGDWDAGQLGRVWWGDTTGAGAGQALACDRDVDGDGLPDLVVGAPWHGGTRGRAYVITGQPLPGSGPLATAADGLVEGLDAEEWLGSSVTVLEVEGTPAVALGGAGWSSGAGRVHLYDGPQLLSEDEPVRIAWFQPPRRTEPDHFGSTLARGDLDGDGLDDLLIGAPDYRFGAETYDAGAVWGWLGKSAGTWHPAMESVEAEHEIEGTRPFGRVGRNMATADLDGDGDDDLLLPMRAEPTL